MNFTSNTWLDYQEVNLKIDNNYLSISSTMWSGNYRIYQNKLSKFDNNKEITDTLRTGSRMPIKPPGHMLSEPQ